MFLDLTFRVKGTEPKMEYDLQQLEGDVDEELINDNFPEYKNIREALSNTFDKWPRNFYFDDDGVDLPYWMEEVFRISISLV